MTTSNYLKPSADGYDNVQPYMIDEEHKNFEPWRGPIGWDVQVRAITLASRSCIGEPQNVFQWAEFNVCRRNMRRR